MATDPRTIIDSSQDPGLSPTPNNSASSNVADYDTRERKTVIIDYTDPPLYGTPELQIFNDPGGANGQVQFNKGNRFGGDNNLVWNSKVRTLSILGNLRVSGEITGRIVTNTTKLKITGGEAGDTLITDGTGNLSWVPAGEAVYGNANVANYLPTYTGILTANAIYTDNYLYANGDPFGGGNANTGNITFNDTTISTVGSSNTILIQPNPTRSDLAWSFFSGEEGNVGVSVLSAPFGDDQHVGELIFPGSNGAGALVYVGNVGTPYDNAMSLLGQNSNVKIVAQDSFWTFNTDGNLTLPANTWSINYANGTQVPIGEASLGDFSFSGNTMSVSDDGTIRAYRGAGYQPNITIELDSAELFPILYSFTSQGLVFPDSTVQNTAYPGYQAPVTVSDNAPNSAIEGDVWFDSQAGRSYVKYNDQWVDMNPTTIPPDPANPFDQDLNTTDNVQFNNINAANLTINDLDTTTLEAGTATIYNLNVPSVIDANIVNAFNVTATSNITAQYFIGDGSQLSNIPFPESNNAIVVSDTAPNANVEGKLWFNSVDGRTYVTYNSQWIDSSPTVMDASALRVDQDDNLELPGSAIFLKGRIYQDVSNGTSSMRWVNIQDDGPFPTELLRAYRSPFLDGNETDERAQLGVIFQNTNTSGLYIKSFDNENEKIWTFEGTGNLRFPDDTVQNTAYPGTPVLIDGGLANTWLTPI